MTPEEIKQLIETGISGSQAFVTGDGYKFEATVISQTFEKLTTIRRHQHVYSTVNEQIASGALHAITINTFTPDEWAAQKGS